MSETFGEMLRRLRIERGMSQNELARRSGADVAYIWHMEAGTKGAPSRATVVKLAEGLGLDPLTTDRLLIAAGKWPWPDQAEDVERALAAVHGDLY